MQGCVEKTPISARSMSTFNSLFEMRLKVDDPLEVVREMDLSILYLRCESKLVYKEIPEAKAAFNSLFEMRRGGNMTQSRLERC